MRRFSLGVGLLLAAATAGRAGPVTSLNQITDWVGSGSNEAGFIIDWNNGQTTQSLIWGYRWNGTATAEDMLRALAGADIGIYATLGDFGSGLGYAVFGLGFDLDRNGQFGVTPALTFVNGVATIDVSQVDSSRQATDPGDYYTENWDTGYWSYWLSTDGSDWNFAPVGISSEVLTNGDWDAFSFAPDFNASPPHPAINPPSVSAAPAPPAIVLLCPGGPALLVLTRRRRRQEAA